MAWLGRVLVLRRLLVLATGLNWLSALPRAGAVSLAAREAAIEKDGSSTQYLIASFPMSRQVNYMKMPDPTWMPLLLQDGFEAPQSICVDRHNRRLFVADPSAGMVYWFQLEMLGDGRLISDGRQRLAASNIVANGLALDSVGNLYISGMSQGTLSMDGIFKQDVHELDKGIPAAATAVWTSKSCMFLAPPGMNDSAPLIFQPTGIALDAFHVYWGNKVRPPNGTALVQANIVGPPRQNLPSLTQAAKERYKARYNATMKPLADNVNGVSGILLTPNAVLYAARGGVYGVNLNQAGRGCGVDGSLCRRVASVIDPTSMVWDGDGTVYVADRGSGRVLSFPSGTLTKHAVVEAAPARGVFSIALFDTKSRACAVTPAALALRLALVMSLMRY